VIPLTAGNSEYKYADIKKPTSGVLADTREIAQQGLGFQCIKHFLGGCTTAFYTDVQEERPKPVEVNPTDEDPVEKKTEETPKEKEPPKKIGVGIIDDPKNIRLMVGDLPYQTAEQLAIEIVNQISPENDGIEGLYQCPRCNNQLLCAEDIERDIDTRDFLRTMKRICRPDEEDNFINMTLSESVEIRTDDARNELEEEFKSFRLRYPTLNDCIKAEELVGRKNTGKLQHSIYKQALVSVNGQPVDRKWKGIYGDMFFRTIKDPMDLVKLSKKLDKYGIERDREKRCPKCEKVWKAQVDITGFFYTALEERSSGKAGNFHLGSGYSRQSS